MPAIPLGGLRLTEGPMAPEAPDDPGVATIKAYFAALDAGDIDGVRAVLDPDAVQTVGGRGPFAGRHEGAEAILALAAGLGGALDALPSMTPLIWLAAGPNAHVVAHVEMVAGGRRLSAEQAMVFRIADGRIVSIRDYQDDQYAFDEFWNAVAPDGLAGPTPAPK